MNPEIIKKIEQAQNLLNECILLASANPQTIRENMELRSPTPSDKQKTLREVVKGREFKNGQEQLAVIIGYHETILGKPVKKSALKDEWFAAKMINKYDTKYYGRAENVFFRESTDDTCALTQGGEEFFDKFIKNESINPTSK